MKTAHNCLLLITSALCAMTPLPLLALPQGGKVAQGTANIVPQGANLTVTQGSDRAVVDWSEFDIAPGEAVHFSQPSATSAILNRIHDHKASAIDGSLTANGQVYLVNPNGMVFGKGAKLDVAGLVATTADITDTAFMAGDLRFDTPGNPDASIVNEGTITAGDAGLAVLVAPTVRNDGTIIAHEGKVALGGGDVMTLDLYGDDLLHLAVSKSASELAVRNTGRIEGRSIALSAASASHVLSSVVNTDGVLQASTARADGKGGIVLGGDIDIAAPFVSLGGKLTANGRDGGSIRVHANSLSLADSIEAKGMGGKGGKVDLQSSGLSMANSTSSIDVSGTYSGGSIHHDAGKGLITSGHYDATSSRGAGGNIDVTAETVVSLSAGFDASGYTKGGRVRIGGEYQGGKNLEVDELANAQTVSLNNATTIKAQGTGTSADGGEAVVWSDVKTIMAGVVDVSPALIGAGGKVELSSADTLLYGGRVNTGRGGSLLLDPKNITIGSVTGTSTFSAVYSIFGADYSGGKSKDISLTDSLDYFGYATSLDGTRLAVGAFGDDGANDSTPSAGAVYLFTFTDTSYNSATLEGIIGKDYTGGKNVDMSGLESNDYFGVSVSLDGNRLAVGAYGDDGSGNAATDVGATYLFSFVDATFSGATLESTIGKGYTGGKNLDIANLEAGDQFGRGVSLDGNRLAVGAPLDSGLANGVNTAGAVYLFSFTDATFSNLTQEALLGRGYTGGKNLDVTALGVNDQLGWAVSLDGNRVAAGARADDGFGNTTTNTGTVYLFSFTDAAFSGGTQEAIIGTGYTGGKNYNLTLDNQDLAGSAISLDGNRLAIGAPNDDGFGNLRSDTGAVYLFSFSDAAFSSPTLQSTMGYGYTGGKNINIATLESSDLFGSGLSLNGNYLAIGAYGDDGGNNLATDSGALSIYSFTDNVFSGGVRRVILGKEYNGGGQTPLNVGTPGGNDQYGYAVALDGTQLAIGAPGDDGYGNSTYNAGVVYLFTFADTTFKDATLQSLVGKGYTGGKNIDVSSLTVNDYFGNSVSLDSNRLAVGAPGHDGSIGAAYLFSFTDAVFSGGTQEAIFGSGYTGGKNFNVTNLGPNDQFGYGISLSGTRLAVGAISDDGFSNGTGGAGAAYLFSFTDTAFNGATLESTIGSGYTGGKNYNLNGVLGGNDLFGSSVSLDGNRLAVSAPRDDANGNGTTDAGAVYLFSFADGVFTTPTLQATIGKGYTGGKNIDIPSLDVNDYFGSSLDLNGNRLIVGAPMDDGPYNNANTNSGAVYLYTFTDAVFSGGALQGIMGSNYTGGKNIHIPTLNNGDQMGWGVALDGNRVAMGAFGGDGLNNQYTDTGAVYLYSFTDAAFSGGTRLTQIGKELTGGPQLATLALPTQSDWFGSAVSLDGTRLAVGARGDDGFGNALNNVGAVYLFSFTDTAFNGGTLESTIGKGYTGGKNINLDFLQSNDQFGSSVSLDGNRLAVGAPTRDTFKGTVYLFTFADAAFNGGALASTLGNGYTGSKDINLTQLSYYDRFGSSVSLDGNRLAVGVQYGDGNGNQYSDSGEVYLFTFTDAVFSGGALAANVGRGYTGGKNVNVSNLGNSDQFGTGIELDGTRLAVGAQSDDGFGNGTPDVGAVYLFSFTDTAFNGGAQEAIIGKGYTGGKNIDVTNLGVQDLFGTTASLNGNRLAVGAPYDDGFGNTLNASGATYLFSFTDAAFNGGTLESTIGKGYTGGKNYDFAALDANEFSGWSVSLDGNRLAIGAYNDDGANNNFAYETGAAHLFSFTDATFSNPALEASIGYDYTGGKNVSVGALDTYNNFGFSLALDGTRLAVGMPRDAGTNNNAPYAGAVYLFSFTDNNFHGGTLESTIGKGYAGGKNYDVTALERGDQFGGGVSLDSNRLAVGAYGDDGSGNVQGDSGAVYLFSFTDAVFSNPTLEATLGRNYAGGKNLAVGVNGSDQFGRAVSLDGNRLAVGAYGDDASGDSTGNSGAVYLFTFTDAAFNGATQEAIIGKGYTGGKNYNLSLDNGDFFGLSLSLDGNRLAVGAIGDDGTGNTATDAGAVYLFSFADAAFTTPTLEATIGKGYTGGKNLDVSRLNNSDQFGNAVSLSGNALAVGANLDDGAGESATNSGAVYLFSFADATFTGGAQEGIVGSYYTGNKSLNIGDAYTLGDQFGSSVSLDGTRLAVGAPVDDGYSGQAADSGATYLLSFTDTAFSGGKLLLTMGPAYTFGGEVAATNSESYGFLGTALSLDGTRLAIGAPYDNGFGNTSANTGAVHLFSFTDNNFTGGTLESSIGKGYTGGKNVNMSTLVSGDLFGSSVSLDGNRLAVGAQGTAHGSGAAYLFSFTDAVFSSGALEASIGNGFTGGKNIDVSNLEYSDQFGGGVSLSGNRLAVGAYQDDGFGKSPQSYNAQTGAVYLFSFADSVFSGGTQEAIIGYDYTGGKNVNISANANNGDQFGASVSLDGNRLAVGTRTDNGFGDSMGNAGAVYLYTFSDAVFNGATQEGIIGSGYTGGKNYNLTALEANDNFGWSVSLDGNRLAVSSGRGDGFGNGWGDSGDVYLFSFTDAFFNGATLQSTIGRGYTGGKNFDLPLGGSDTFGEGLSLDGNRLAIGASRDDGYDNTIQDSGAVYLFSFSDSTFSNPTLLRTIGAGYNYGAEISVTGPESNSQFGYAVSIDGTRMAVGAPTDDGFGNSAAASGVVYLFSFADDVLNGATLEGMIGKGFSGGKNINVSNLSAKDYFGSALSLDGARLAVGAQGDTNSSGAVYLFSFTDSVFSGGTQEATIGSNYSGGKNLTVSNLSANDQFGAAVSLDGNRLAVGAYSDDANANAVGDAGAVYLFSFTDAQFSGGTLESTIGRNYTGGKNYNHTALTGSDQFGSAVSLDGNRLAVGAWRDDGSGNVAGDSGSVYLFSFADATFSAPTLESTIGKSYAGGKNIDVTNLGGSDLFGSAVSLSGTRLAVGAELDDGTANAKTNAGAVYLFSFTDTAFNGGTQEAIFGHNYTGGKNIDLSSSLDANDNFGYAVSLDGTHLAIGAPFDDGYLNKATNSGAVYIFSEAGDAVASASTFANAPAASITITPNELTDLLNAGTAVTLQASNDITVNSPIVANNIAGNGGNIFFQAGRSILLNAGITTDNGNLTLTANDTLAHGVVDAQRDAGAAAITFANGVSVNAGTGNVTIELLDGAGKTFTDGGDITLGSITANTIFTRNYSTAGDVILRSGTSLTASGAGTNTTLISGRNFINNAGAAPLNPGAGRALIYSSDPAADTLGGMPRGFKRYSCTYGGACPALPATGNGFLYSLSPTVTVTANDTSRQIGLPNPSFTATYTGYIDGDTFATVFTGAPDLTSAAGAGSPVGAYAITSAVGTLANDLGYNLAFADGTLTVTSPPAGGGAPPVVLLPTEEPPVSTPPAPTPTVPTPTPTPPNPSTPPSEGTAPPVVINEETQIIPLLLETAIATTISETSGSSSDDSGESGSRSGQRLHTETGDAPHSSAQNGPSGLISYSNSMLELLGCNSSEDANCQNLK